MKTVPSHCIDISNPNGVDFRLPIQRFIEDYLPDLVSRSYRYCEVQWRRYGIEVNRETPAAAPKFSKFAEGNVYGITILGETEFDLYIWNRVMQEYDCLHCKVIV